LASQAVREIEKGVVMKYPKAVPACHSLFLDTPGLPRLVLLPVSCQALTGASSMYHIRGLFLGAIYELTYK
jgi:hypothetical protein